MSGTYPGDRRDILVGLVRRNVTNEADIEAILAAADAYATASPVRARCPICVRGLPFADFTARTDEELFAKIASHVMQVHNGGGTDAFNTAELVLPHIGQRWRDRVAADPDAYRKDSS